MLKTKKLLKKAIVTLFIVAASIIILAVWISRDDYVPQKLGNSVSAALNNRYRLRYGCSIAENSDYIFYVNRSNNSCQLFRINKKKWRKDLVDEWCRRQEILVAYLFINNRLYMQNQKIKIIKNFITIYTHQILMVKNVKLIKKEMWSSSYGNRWLDVFPG